METVFLFVSAATLVRSIRNTNRKKQRAEKTDSLFTDATETAIRTHAESLIAVQLHEQLVVQLATSMQDCMT